MTQIVLSFDATPPADEHQPEGWAIGYVVGILRTAGVVVHDAKAMVAAPVDLEGLDVGPGVRKVLAQAAKDAAEIDNPPLPVTCPWCDREFHPHGLSIHQARCKMRPAATWGPTDPGAAGVPGTPLAVPDPADEPPPVPTLVGVDDRAAREARHAARRAAAADAM